MLAWECVMDVLKMKEYKQSCTYLLYESDNISETVQLINNITDH